MASRIISPTPKVVVRSGLRLSAGTSGSPAAADISITAVVPSGRMPYCASRGSPSGPVTQTLRSVPPRPSVSASTVPSPPSATGCTCTAASGKTRKIPSRTASPACRELRLPLKESIATITFIT